jgi:hypothetical protein
MNFDESIAAHSAWKTKLRTYLKKPDKSLVAAAIRKDDECALGKWIHGEGRRYGADPDFRELQKEHAVFHGAAADLVDRAHSGEAVAEETVLGANSSFSQVSGRVVQLIVKMKNKHLAA